MKYERTFEVHEPHKNDRVSLFRGTAKSSDGMTWNVHVMADYIPTVIEMGVTGNPMDIIMQAYAEWRTACP